MIVAARDILWFIPVGIGAFIACDPPRPKPHPPAASASSRPSTGAALPSALVPRERGDRPPSQSRLSEGSVTGHDLARVDDCARCHAATAEQWRASSHAFATFNNPVYRTNVDHLRASVGAKQSRHCGGCHDPALQLDGAMDTAIRAEDPRRDAGVSCRICHGAVDATADGNGSYTIGSEPLVLPVASKPNSTAAHKRAVRPAPIKTQSLCLGCHRGFLPKPERQLTGVGDVDQWQVSAYAGALSSRVDWPVEKRSCVDCHMPTIAAELADSAATDGKVKSHEFLAGHTWLAQMRGDADRQARIARALKGVVDLHIVRVEVDGQSRWLPTRVGLTPGDEATIDVVVHNRRVGHRFPGGVLDIQDTRLEVELVDAQGKRLAGSVGRVAHRFEAGLADKDGVILHEHETADAAAIVYNTAIPARDSRVIRYRFIVPDQREPVAPITIRARIVHRSRSPAMQRAACRDARKRRAAKAALDPCPPQPETTIADVRTTIGGADDGAPDPRVLLEHGVGLLHGLQETLEQARPSLTAARQAMRKRGDARGEAMALWGLAKLAADHGRPYEAKQLAEAGLALLPGHPALLRVVGRAMARVWRWPEASSWLRRAVGTGTSDHRLLGELATALGSAGRPGGALNAAIAGLRVNPRSEALLRAQATSLAALGAPEAQTALSAYLRHRAPDAASSIRLACQKRDARCRLERSPVHVHVLR